MSGGDIAALRERARAGDVRALTSLGWRLLIGEGVRQSPQEGISCFDAAATRGDVAAAHPAPARRWGMRTVVAQLRSAVGRNIERCLRASCNAWRSADDIGLGR